MRTFELPSILATPTTPYDFTWTVEGVTRTIWTGDEFVNIVKSRYNHLLFDSFDATESQTEAAAKATATAEFISDLTVWRSLHGEDFWRAIGALYAEYNPLENYDRLEEGSETDEKHKGSVVTETVTEAGTETNAHHKGTKTSFGEETIVTPRVKTKNTTYKTAFDSSAETETDALVSEPIDGTDKTERDATKNFTTQSDIDANTYDRDEKSFANRSTTRTTEAADKSATVFDKDVHTFTNRRTHGNIGVTTSMELIASEWDDLRLKGYREGLIRMFIGEYCYYFKGVE